MKDEKILEGYLTAIKEDFNRVDERFDRLEKKMDNGFNAIDKRFAGIDQHFANVDQQLANIDQRLDNQQETLAKIALNTDTILKLYKVQVGQLKENMGVQKKMEKRLTKLERSHA